MKHLNLEYFHIYNGLSRTESQNSEERMMADNNRNWSLALAQLSWIALVGRANVVSTGACQAFGAITHLSWLATFMWTGNFRIIY